MNKEIQVLYSIFELELKPPFKLVDLVDDMPVILYNKKSEKLGWYGLKTNSIHLSKSDQLESVLRKIRAIYNIDELSDDDLSTITMHLFKWLQSKNFDRIRRVTIYGKFGSVSHP